MQFVISAVGVLVFAGLTAYDTQKIKEMYFEADDQATMGRKAIMGALNLYLDFINLFLMLLQLFGNRNKPVTASVFHTRTPDAQASGVFVMT